MPMYRCRRQCSDVSNLSSYATKSEAAERHRGPNPDTQQLPRSSAGSRSYVIVASTGVARARMSGKTKVRLARTSGGDDRLVETADVAIPLTEYGSPVWVRALNPMADGKRGRPASSMRGAEATGWSARRRR